MIDPDNILYLRRDVVGPNSRVAWLLCENCNKRRSMNEIVSNMYLNKYGRHTRWCPTCASGAVKFFEMIRSSPVRRST